MAMMNWTSLSTTMKREHRKLEPNNYNDLKNGWAAAWGEKPPKNEPCTQNNSLGQMEQTNHLLMTPMYRKVTVALLL